MDVFVIEGGRKLSGTVRINGSKNAALPLMAAALLTDDELILDDVPNLSDIRNMTKLLSELGVLSTHETSSGAGSDTGSGSGQSITHRVTDPSQSHARYEIVRTMRASISTLGPLLAKRGHARVSLPGGCAIGQRPVDLHLRGLEALGAKIILDGGDIIASAPGGGRLIGAPVFLGGPFGSTVLGTANILSAATLAHGTTTIESAACEPEIVDLANMLIAMGAKITGAGSPRIIIEGVEELGGTTHRVMPDRIEAGTYMCASAITNSELVLENCPLDAMMSAVETLKHMGIYVTNIGDDSDPMRRSCTMTRDETQLIKPVQITTQPHPGFPTDLQAQFMALLCLSNGNSVITEKIFPERFLHVAELCRMGAQIHRQGATAVVTGVARLAGAPVMASDLRASAGLVIAGLAAEGQTVINRVYHIDRGYEHMEDTLAGVGASIRRADAEEFADTAMSI